MKTKACGTSGCGAAAAYLDTSTARVAGWVEVRRNGGAAATSTWFCSALCAALDLGGAEIGTAIRTMLADDLTAAAASLIETADLAEPVLLERHRGIETARRLVEPDQVDDVARCHVCTEDDACAGGCAWVPGGMQDTCTACAPPVPCTTPDCGVPEDEVDGSDPTLWGWICIYVGGSDTRMRWVCSPGCAVEAIDAGGAELASQELTAPAGGEPR